MPVTSGLGKKYRKWLWTGGGCQKIEGVLHANRSRDPCPRQNPARQNLAVERVEARLDSARDKKLLTFILE